MSKKNVVKAKVQNDKKPNIVVSERFLSSLLAMGFKKQTTLNIVNAAGIKPLCKPNIFFILQK